MSRIARSAVQHARRTLVAPMVMTRVAACRPAASMVHTRLAQQWTPIRCFLSPPGDKSGMISTQPSPDGKGTIPVVLVQDAKKIWKDFDAVVDVREAAEVAEGMIPGAVHIPLGQVQANPDLKQFKDKKVLVYCRAGVRSAKAVAAMQGCGIDAVNLGGGYLAWEGDASNKLKL